MIILLRIASLLHDIGKLYQRTGIWINITKYKKYLVYRDRKYLYYHAAYTGSFLNEYFGIEELSSLAASHHLPIKSIVKESDMIAAAHDRRDSDYDDNSNQDYILMRLSSIFNLIGDNIGSEIVEMKKYLHFNGFINNKTRSLQDAKAEYLSLYQEFIEEIKPLKALSLEQSYHYLFGILKEYLYAIPASTYQVEYAYVSLFDHLKLTAAIANCLNQTSLKKQFVILKYHIRGITDFVYQDDDIDMIYGRSAYINLLGDFIVYAILHEFDLGYENIMYSLGGQGRILLPNKRDIKQKLQGIYNRINQIVNISHDGIINIVLSYDIYDDINLRQNKLINNLNENEKNVLKVDKNVTKDTKIIDYYSIGKKILNNNIIIEYNFGKKNHNNNDIYFDGFGGICFSPQSISPMSFYQEFNGGIIGETKTYRRINNHQLNENSVMILMDIKNTNDIFLHRIKETSQSFSTFLTLSRTLELFFSKIVPDICLEFPMNLMYTSGDDIIMIANLEDSEIIINAIKNGFEKYTNNNKEFIWKIKIQNIEKSIYKAYQEIK